MEYLISDKCFNSHERCYEELKYIHNRIETQPLTMQLTSRNSRVIASIIRKQQTSFKFQYLEA